MCPLGRPWIHPGVMTPGPECIIRIDTFGVAPTVDPWPAELSQGKGQMEVLEIAFTPTLSLAKIVNQKEYHIPGMEMCAH